MRVHAVWVALARRRLELGMLATALLLGGFTLAVIRAPGEASLGASVAAQMVISTTITGACGLLATLAWFRYRELGSIGLPYQAVAFATLGLVNAYFLVAAMFQPTDWFRAESSPATLLVFDLGRLSFAIFMLVGGLAAVRRTHRVPALRRGVYLLGPGLLLVLVLLGAGVSWLWRTADPQSVMFAAGHTPMVSLLVHAPIALVFLLASLAYRELYQREGEAANAALSLGLLVCAFAQVHSASTSGEHSAQVTSDEVLRLVAYGVFVAGAAVQSRADIRRLVRADRDLVRLRQLEREREALQDRQHLAREIHDGIAQDLWLTKLAYGQLREKLPPSPELEALADDVDTALQTAVATTRQAISWIQNASVSRSTAFSEALADAAEEFSRRFGLRVETVVDDAPQLDPGVQVELLRITQEALRNTLKHARATKAILSLAVGERWLEIRIQDDGRGFELDRIPIGSFGLMTMSRRAEVIGADLDVSSRPQAGTRVTVRLPLRKPLPATTGSDAEATRGSGGEASTPAGSVRPDTGNLALS